MMGGVLLLTHTIEDTGMFGYKHARNGTVIAVFWQHGHIVEFFTLLICETWDEVSAWEQIALVFLPGVC